MTRHDSWVHLRGGSPYEYLLQLFPKGFPVRDPFPMHTGKKRNGAVVSIWAIDIERLDKYQRQVVANAIAIQAGVDPAEVLEEAIAHGSFGLDEKWVECLEVGAEGYARLLELRKYLLANPLLTKSTSQAMRDFMDDQIKRWIKGNEIPPPLPTKVKEIPEDLRSPELEAAILRNNLNSRLLPVFS